MNLIKTAKQSNVELTERFKSELETLTPMFDNLVESKQKEMVFVSHIQLSKQIHTAFTRKTVLRCGIGRSGSHC